MLRFMAMEFYRSNPLLGYAIFALGVFVAVFLAILARTFFSDDERYAELASLPLKEGHGSEVGRE
ncbi:MAG: hypothetical protein QM778_16670 [Myxococcales bacterium]